MGLDTSLSFAVGVSMGELCPGETLESENVTVTKYDQNDGHPYTVPVQKIFAKLVNGVRIELPNSSFSRTRPLREYFEKMEFECSGYCDNFFHGVVGLKIGKRESVSGCQTVSLKVPTEKQVNEVIPKVKELFKKNGFSEQIIESVALYAIMDASY